MIAATAAPATQAGAAEQVTFVSWGGITQEAEIAGLFMQAEELGIEILEDQHGGFSGLLTHVTAGQVTWDLAAMGWSRCAQAEQNGLLAPLDYGVIDASAINPAFVDDHWVGAFTFSYGIGYRTDVYGGDGPANWADFWDVEAFPGVRSLFASGIYALEAALMADGVPMEAVYELLRTEAGVDRAFAKLDELKPHVGVYWTSSGQAIQLIRDGEVDMILIANGRAAAVIADGAPVAFTFNQGLLEVECLMVPKGAPNAAAAMRLIDSALQPVPQATFSAMIEYGPVNPAAYEAGIITPERVAILPTAPGNVERQLLVDFQWYASPIGEAAIERFSRWMQE